MTRNKKDSLIIAGFALTCCFCGCVFVDLWWWWLDTLENQVPLIFIGIDG